MARHPRKAKTKTEKAIKDLVDSEKADKERRNKRKSLGKDPDDDSSMGEFFDENPFQENDKQEEHVGTPLKKSSAVDLIIPLGERKNARGDSSYEDPHSEKSPSEFSYDSGSESDHPLENAGEPLEPHDVPKKPLKIPKNDRVFKTNGEGNSSTPQPISTHDSSDLVSKRTIMLYKSPQEPDTTDKAPEMTSNELWRNENVKVYVMQKNPSDSVQQAMELLDRRCTEGLLVTSSKNQTSSKAFKYDADSKDNIAAHVAKKTYGKSATNFDSTLYTGLSKTIKGLYAIRMSYDGDARECWGLYKDPIVALIARKRLYYYIQGLPANTPLIDVVLYSRKIQRDLNVPESAIKGQYQMLQHHGYYWRFRFPMFESYPHFTFTNETTGQEFRTRMISYFATSIENKGLSVETSWTLVSNRAKLIEEEMKGKGYVFDESPLR